MELLRMDFFSGLGCCQVQAGEEKGDGALKYTGSRHHPSAKSPEACEQSATHRACERSSAFASAWSLAPVCLRMDFEDDNSVP